ncbi:uncharacterized protein LOC105664551 [Ceratitis capitata]|uniref:uncharacterized protein LOC105664551 n=1 Tax=Ceratitis capitata TaxID=7213 RepID=UPI000C6C6AA0|nr:uncharacterized protein LOC105664551 [Ceratitis capitata]
MCVCSSQQSTMTQQLSPLKLLVSLYLLRLAISNCCYTPVHAVPFETSEDVAGAGQSIGDAVAAVLRDANNCFETYMQESRNASDTYASAYRTCRELGSKRRMEFTQMQCSTRQDMVGQVTEMCKNFCDCAEIDGDLEFFQCSARNAYKGMSTLQYVYLNSSAAIVELENKYQEAEKEILFCTIAAEERYINATAKAFVQLSKCLKAS